jgi:hypothetical protein
MKYQTPRRINHRTTPLATSTDVNLVSHEDAVSHGANERQHPLMLAFPYQISRRTAVEQPVRRHQPGIGLIARQDLSRRCGYAK